MKRDASPTYILIVLIIIVLLGIVMILFLKEKVQQSPLSLNERIKKVNVEVTLPSEIKEYLDKEELEYYFGSDARLFLIGEYSKLADDESSVRLKDLNRDIGRFDDMLVVLGNGEGGSVSAPKFSF